MVKKEVTIMQEANSELLTATIPESKFTAMLIQKASCFKSGIWIIKGDRKANAKSLLGLISLGLCSGASVTLTAEGEDEGEALSELTRYLATGV